MDSVAKGVEEYPIDLRRVLRISDKDLTAFRKL
jgi:hypothetical protein